MCVQEETTRHLGKHLGNTTMSHQKCMDALLCQQGLSVSDKLAAEVRPVEMNSRQNYTWIIVSSECHPLMVELQVTSTHVGTVLEYSGTTWTSESFLCYTL
jgi:hypothetical protein